MKFLTYQNNLFENDAKMNMSVYILFVISKHLFLIYGDVFENKLLYCFA